MPPLAKLCLVLLVTLNVSIASWNALQYLFHRTQDSPKHPDYTYIGADFPAYHPFLNVAPASITLQESVRYNLNASDLISSAEWETFNGYPGGYGRAHLGPNRRSFLMTFYHQLHCIRELQKALVDRSNTSATSHHVNHCIQYLRQTFLCGAADMLEKGDFILKDYKVERVGSELVCLDWEAVYGKLDESWASFTEWRSKWN